MKALAVSIAVATMACHVRDPGVVHTTEDEPQAPPDPHVIATFATPLELTVGETAEVRCVVPLNEEYLADVATRIEVTPDAKTVASNSTAWTFSPTTAGECRVFCSTEDGSLTDEQGIRVTALPAAPADIDTTLSAKVAEAGLPVDVSCDIYDAFGNFIDELHADRVVTDDGLRHHPPVGPGSWYTAHSWVTTRSVVRSERSSIAHPSFSPKASLCSPERTQLSKSTRCNRTRRKKG